MQQRDPFEQEKSSDFWRLSTQQNVSLDKHRQMLRDASQWQETPPFPEEEQQSTTKRLLTRFTRFLRPLMNNIRVKSSKPEKAPCDQQAVNNEFGR